MLAASIPTPSLEQRLAGARDSLYSPEGRRVLDELIDSPEAVGTAERAHALLLRANQRARRAQVLAAGDAQAAMAWFTAHGTDVEVAECLLTLGLASAIQGNVEEALDFLLPARATAAAAGAHDTLAGVLNCLGFLLSDLGELETADRVLRLAISLATRGSTTLRRMLAQSNLAQNLIRQAQPRARTGLAGRERELLREALALLSDVESFRRAMNDVVGVSAALDNRAQAYLARGEPDRALTLLAEALALSNLADDAPGAYHALVHRARAHLALGDATAAALCAREALSPAARAGLSPRQALAALAAAELELDLDPPESQDEGAAWGPGARARARLGEFDLLEV